MTDTPEQEALRWHAAPASAAATSSQSSTAKSGRCGLRIYEGASAVQKVGIARQTLSGA